MKNFSVNLNKEAASPGEKLISYNHAGGIYAIIIFIASVLGTASLVISFIIIALFGNEAFSVSPIVLIVLLISFLILFGLCAADVIVFSILQAKNYNKGFEIYPEKVLFLDNVKAKKPFSKRNLIFAIIFSCIFNLYYWYWLAMMVYNTKLLTHKKGSQVGETLCILFVPFYHFYWMYTRSRQVRDELIKRGLECTFRPGLMLFLDIIGVGIIPIAIMQHHFNFLSDERVLTEEEYEKHVQENTFSFNCINRVYTTITEFTVESNNKTKTVMLTSRDFKRNLNNLIAYNT